MTSPCDKASGLALALAIVRERRSSQHWKRKAEETEEKIKSLKQLKSELQVFHVSNNFQLADGNNDTTYNDGHGSMLGMDSISPCFSIEATGTGRSMQSFLRRVRALAQVKNLQKGSDVDIAGWQSPMVHKREALTMVVRFVTTFIDENIAVMPSKQEEQIVIQSIDFILDAMRTRSVDPDEEKQTSSTIASFINTMLVETQKSPPCNTDAGGTGLRSQKVLLHLSKMPSLGLQVLQESSEMVHQMSSKLHEEDPFAGDTFVQSFRGCAFLLQLQEKILQAFLKSWLRDDEFDEVAFSDWFTLSAKRILAMQLSKHDSILISSHATRVVGIVIQQVQDSKKAGVLYTRTLDAMNFLIKSAKSVLRGSSQHLRGG